MDNYFQYLLFLFIIISLLSSFFKKKDKPESKRRRTTPRPPLKPQQSSQQDDYDILNEIENMFKTQSSQTEKQPESIPAEEKKYKPSEHTEDPEWHEETPSEHRMGSWDERRKKTEDKLKQNLNEKILREAKMFEKNLAKKSQVVDIRKDLIRKMKQPSNLKGYVIISEILGKPKAFQE
jgi:hypothetical protein